MSETSDALQGVPKVLLTPVTARRRDTGEWVDLPCGAVIEFGLGGKFATVEVAARGWPSMEIEVPAHGLSWMQRR